MRRGSHLLLLLLLALPPVHASGFDTLFYDEDLNPLGVSVVFSDPGNQSFYLRIPKNAIVENASMTVSRLDPPRTYVAGLAKEEMNKILAICKANEDGYCLLEYTIQAPVRLENLTLAWREKSPPVGGLSSKKIRATITVLAISAVVGVGLGLFLFKITEQRQYAADAESLASLLIAGKLDRKAMYYTTQREYDKLVVNTPPEVIPRKQVGGTLYAWPPFSITFVDVSLEDKRKYGDTITAISQELGIKKLQGGEKR